MRTEYEIVDVCEGRKSLKGQIIKTIKGFMNVLKDGESVWARQIDVDPKCKTEYFKRFTVGYRQFTMEKNGLSYTRYPQHEY